MRATFFIALALCGCARLQVKKDQVTAVHKVAFADYAIELSLGSTTSTTGNQVHGLVGGMRAADDERSGRLAARRAEEVDRGSELLKTRLTKEFGWEFVTPQDADALISMKVEYRTGKTDGTARQGLGTVKRYPVAVVTFALLRRDGEVLWSDPHARGTISTEPLEVTMGFDVLDNEVQVLTETAASAFDELLRRYRMDGVYY